MLRFAIPLLMLLALIAAYLFFASIAGITVVCLLALGLGISIVSILRRQFQRYRAGQIDRVGLVRNCGVEITGILITLALSIILARWAVAYLIAQVSGMLGFILGMPVALLVGIVMCLVVQSTWGRLVKGPTRA